MTTLPTIGIALGAGFVAALLFASAASGNLMTLAFFYLAPLPLFLVGLGWGKTAAISAGAMGTVLTALMAGPTAATLFALSLAAPAVFLIHLLSLFRAGQTAIPSGQKSSDTVTRDGKDRQDTAVEWYPIGRVVGWTAVLAGALSSLGILMLGTDAASYASQTKEMFRQIFFAGGAKTPAGKALSQAEIDRILTTLTDLLPAASATVWMGATLGNLWVAGHVVRVSGHLLRPWPRLQNLSLPPFVALGFAVSLVAMSLLSGLPALFATAFAAAFFLAFLLLGLAVLHDFTEGMPLRIPLLIALYLGMVLFGWLAIAIGAVGLAEFLFNLRDRFSPPPGPGTTSQT